MIDIIIPAYNAHKTIRKTLLSIASQDSIDKIKVYIVNDCSKKDYKEEVKDFKRLMDIHEIDLPHNSGPGAARQYGVDHTDSEYIYFLDSDDLLYDDNAITILLNGIDGYDMVKGGVWEEYAPNEFYNNVDDVFSLHGKLYKRSIIEKNNIKFNPFRSKEANAHEDNSYNNLYELCCNKINVLEDMVYTYTVNFDSITKTEVSEVKNRENFCIAMDWFAEEIDKRKFKKETYNRIMKKILFVIAYCFNNYFLYPDEYEFMFDKLGHVKKVYNKYKDYLLYDDLISTYNFFNYPIIPTMTIYEFIDKIKEAD